MANSKKIQGARNCLIVKSIAAAISIDEQKKKNSCIIIAYAKGDSVEDICFTAIKLPKSKTYRRDDFLSAVCHAENADSLTYIDFDGKDKDIYICRAKDGEVYDFVERNDVKNSYIDGFAEIEASSLKFSVNPVQIDFDKFPDVNVSYNPDGIAYERNSLQYALVNAFNACLLGKVLSGEEFHLETGDGTRVKYEVRTFSAKYVDPSTLYIRPQTNEVDSFINSYVTEPMNVIDGDEMITKVYKLVYRASFNGYYVTRQN